MDFSHYIMHTIQHIIKCEQDIMTMVNQMILFLTIRQLWRHILSSILVREIMIPMQNAHIYEPVHEKTNNLGSD